MNIEVTATFYEKLGKRCEDCGQFNSILFTLKDMVKDHETCTTCLALTHFHKKRSPC